MWLHWEEQIKGFSDPRSDRNFETDREGLIGILRFYRRGKQRRWLRYAQLTEQVILVKPVV
jgi:hypothetical protein